MLKIILNFINKRESLVIAILATITAMLAVPITWNIATAPVEIKRSGFKPEDPYFTVTVEKAPHYHKGIFVEKGDECKVDLINGVFKNMNPKATRGKIPFMYEIFTNKKLPRDQCPSQTFFRITILEQEEIKKRGARL